MYEQFFGFFERPFSIAPDPKFLYLSERHRDALAHLVYGLNDQGGFVMLTGEVGTGKTTLCRSLLEQVPANIDVAFMLNPRLDAVELLESIADELHLDRSAAHGSIKNLVDCINEHLILSNAAGQSTVLLIDEAQNLSAEVLEQLRLLTNLETNERKLLRIILIGQPELAEKLARPELRQLAQRITARYHLAPLSSLDTAAYVQHRLSIAGATDAVFTPAAVRRLHRIAGGIPRIINVVADRALLGAYANNVRRIGPTMISRAAREVQGAPLNRKRWWPFVAAAVLALGTFGGWQLFAKSSSSPTAAMPAPRIAAPLSTTVQLPASSAMDKPATDTPAPRTTATPFAAAAKRAAKTSPSTKPSPDSITTHGEPPQNLLAAAVHGETIRPQPGVAERTATISTDAETALVAPSNDATLVVKPDGSTASNVSADLPAAAPSWPAASVREKSLDQAFAALFARWHTPYQRQSDETACRYAARVGLACLFGQGAWSALLTLNRPVILKLYDSSGAYSATLLAVKGDRAQVDIAGRSQWLSAAAVDDAWHGQYTALWQTPTGYREPVGPGTSGPAVVWLRDKLHQLTGAELASATPERFDESLSAALKSYQITKGLTADGHAGPRTWIALHDATGQANPHLRPE